MFPNLETRFLSKALRPDRRRNEVEGDIQTFLDSISRSKGSMLVDDNDMFKSLEKHRGVSDQVHVGCDNIDKLLTDLQDMTARGTKETVEQQQATMRRMRGGGEFADSDEVRRMRTFAAEDTTMEGSMTNYAIEPPAIPVQSGIEEEIAEIIVSLNKIRDSTEKLRNILDDNVQWWNSTITIRRIKTHALRCNFHARRVRKWGNFSRQTVLINATSINKLATEASTEIREHQHNLHQLKTRREVAGLKLVQQETESMQLVKLMASAMDDKAIMDQAVLEAGRASMRISGSKQDTARIEAVLLVDKLTVLKSLAEDAEVVKTWLYHQNSFPS